MLGAKRRSFHRRLGLIWPPFGHPFGTACHLLAVCDFWSWLMLPTSKKLHHCGCAKFAPKNFCWSIIHCNLIIMLYPESNRFLFNMPRITWDNRVETPWTPTSTKGFWINGSVNRSLKALFQQAAASVRQSVRQDEPVTPKLWAEAIAGRSPGYQSTIIVEIRWMSLTLWPCFDPVGISWPDPGCMFGLIKEVSSRQGKQVSPDLQSTRCLRARAVGNPDLHVLMRTCQTPNKQNCVGTWRLTVPQLNRPMQCRTWHGHHSGSLADSVEVVRVCVKIVPSALKNKAS